MGSIPVGSTKTTVKTVVFTSNGESKDDVPSSTLPERSASSLMHGSTKINVKTVVFI